MMMLEHVRRQADEFDCHAFSIWTTIRSRCFRRQTVPFVTTLHGRLDLPEHQPVFTHAFLQVPVVSISDSQRRPVPQAELGADGPSWPAAAIADAACRSSGNTSPFSAAFRPRRGSTGQFRLPANAGVPLRIAAKVDKRTANISTK